MTQHRGITPRRTRLSLAAAFSGLLLTLVPCIAQAGNSVCAEVQLEIAQELTLERQAFEAHMRIKNGASHLTLDNLSVDVYFTDEAGAPVVATSDPDNELAAFFIRLDTTEQVDALQVKPNQLDFSGKVLPSTSAAA